MAHKEGGRRYGRIGAYFVEHWYYFAVGAVFLALTNYLSLQIPRLIGGAIQALKEAELDVASLDLAVVQEAAWLIAALAVGSAGVRILSRIFVFNGGRLIEYQIRNEVFEHLTRLGQPFFQSAATGDVVSRVGNDISYIRAFYGFGVLQIVNTVVAFVIVLTQMTELNTELMFYTLLPYPIFSITLASFTNAMYKRTMAVQLSLAEISAKAQENLSGAAVVKSFSIQRQESEAFKVRSDGYVDANLSLARVRGALIPLVGAIPAVGTLIVLALGGEMVAAGELELGEFVEFTGYVVALAFPAAGIAWMVMVWHRGMAAFDRLFQITDTEPMIEEPAIGEATELPLTPSGRIRGEIVFEGVGLVYEDGTRALAGVDLRIEAGSRVAIVGRTGSGKTSLVDLIPRLRDPTEGRILIDGVPLPEARLFELRRQIGYAPQDPFLFSTTIEDNIRFGLLARAHIDPERGEGRVSLEDAMRIAHLTGDLPAFPEGLKTVVGERGITLSGGQKQRVTIARAVLLDPSILILDDSLSSVDTRTERAILTELESLMTGRTSILVTHRFNALELVDKIVVMDRGGIVEVGTHVELLEKEGGVYAQMVERQQLREALEEQ